MLTSYDSSSLTKAERRKVLEGKTTISAASSPKKGAVERRLLLQLRGEGQALLFPGSSTNVEHEKRDGGRVFREIGMGEG